MWWLVGAVVVAAAYWAAWRWVASWADDEAPGVGRGAAAAVFGTPPAIVAVSVVAMLAQLAG